MKPYGIKHTLKHSCACEVCGSDSKLVLKKRERNRTKKEINEYKLIVKSSKPSFSKKDD